MIVSVQELWKDVYNVKFDFSFVVSIVSVGDSEFRQFISI